MSTLDLIQTVVSVAALALSVALAVLDWHRHKLRFAIRNAESRSFFLQDSFVFVLTMDVVNFSSAPLTILSAEVSHPDHASTFVLPLLQGYRLESLLSSCTESCQETLRRLLLPCTLLPSAVPGGSSAQVSLVCCTRRSHPVTSAHHQLLAVWQAELADSCSTGCQAFSDHLQYETATTRPARYPVDIAFQLASRSAVAVRHVQTDVLPCP
ncbi:MAG: hypothetical protein J6K73_05095 [Clostridia bacterium]|nr:hypothetical protein [Clostridia bacterium]